MRPTDSCHGEGLVQSEKCARQLWSSQEERLAGGKGRAVFRAFRGRFPGERQLRKHRRTGKEELARLKTGERAHIPVKAGCGQTVSVDAELSKAAYGVGTGVVEKTALKRVLK